MDAGITKQIHDFGFKGFCRVCGCSCDLNDYSYTEVCIDPADFYYDYCYDIEQDIPNVPILTQVEEDELPF